MTFFGTSGAAGDPPPPFLPHQNLAPTIFFERKSLLEVACSQDKGVVMINKKKAPQNSKLRRSERKQEHYNFLVCTAV